MYDSVYPTRTARFGVALVPEGMLKLKNSTFLHDYRCRRLGRGLERVSTCRPAG